MSWKYPRDYNCATETWSKSKDGNHYLTEHFRVKEFACKDGADEVVICPDLLNKCLEPLFTKMNAKVININSGYRTVSHSLDVGGKGETDNHHMGMAADIVVKKQDGTFYTAKEVCLALQDMNWQGGIGLMMTAVHIDTGSQYWFDETQNSKQVDDWYNYFGVEKTSPIKAELMKTYKLTCSWINVRVGANGPKYAKLYKGQLFNVYETKNGWLRIDESNHWIKPGKSYKEI